MSDAVKTPTEESELSVFALTLPLFQHKRLFTLLPLALFAAGIAFGYFFPSYKAKSSFVPDQSSSKLSQLAGMAAQFGFSLGNIGEAESVDFYSQLLRSRDVLKST